jgi:predicted GIY-YIG superfamily endonuclease
MRDERRYFGYIRANPSKKLYTGARSASAAEWTEHKLKLTPGFAAQYNIPRLVDTREFRRRPKCDRT